MKLFDKASASMDRSPSLPRSSLILPYRIVVSIVLANLEIFFSSLSWGRHAERAMAGLRGSIGVGGAGLL